ncbi:transglutaminase-like domain-containing protein [Capsulimonas corticalis]|nr:transglutaminase family protein [Capsulimonas corticalis]
MQRKPMVAAWAVSALLLLPLAQGHAKTISFTGSMKTQLDFTRTYVVDVGAPLKTLTLSIPIPQSGSIFGYAETTNAPIIESSAPATSEKDVTDHFGNFTHVMEFDNVAPGTLTVQVTVKELTLATDLDTGLPTAPFPVDVTDGDAIICLKPTQNSQSDSDEIRALAQTITTGAADEAAAARAISTWMVSNITYDDAADRVRTPALTTLANHKARCDGWANLFMAIARASGIPARYAGGYWISPQISYTGGAPTIQKVASDHTHAWVELWFPNAGWIPYEPQQTVGFVDTHHLRVWQLPDSAASAQTLNFTADSATRPPVELKLTSSFDNLTDTITLTPGETTEEAGEKNLFLRK